MASNNSDDSKKKAIAGAGSIAELSWVFYQAMRRMGAPVDVAKSGMNSYITGLIMSSASIAKSKPPEK